jgi:hypothetical protein
MTWYYEQSGQRQGPVPDEELDRLIAAGVVTQNTLVWCEGMADWAPLSTARPTSAGGTEAPPPGWIRCTATGRYFPPSEIVYIDGKPYSAAAKPAVVQGLMQSGSLPLSADEGRTGPAWERRAELGIFKAGLETLKGVLLDPAATFSTMKREGGLGGPLLYVVLFGSLGSIVGLGYNLVFNVGSQSFIPPEMRQQSGNMPFAAGMTVGLFMVLAVIMPALIAIGMFIGAAILHLSLMICGGAKQPFETTFRTYCYAQGSATVLQVVPICGALVGGIWGLVCACIGLSKTHEIGIGRAVLAVLLPAIICCGGTILIFGFIFAAAGVNAGHH